MAQFTVEVQPNGYIHIDMTSEAAKEIGAVAYSGQGRADAVMDALARAVSQHPANTIFKWFRLKRGLSNAGWTATYLDQRKHADYIAAHSEYAAANPEAARDAGR